MNGEQLDLIIQEAPPAIGALLGDLRPKILEAARAALEESQDSDTGKAVAKVSLVLAIDLCTAPVSWHVEAAVGMRYKVKGDNRVADTSPELPGLEGGAR